MKDKLIWCNTKEKLADVIAKLKKDGYSVPDVDYAWNSYGDEVTLRVKAQVKDVTFASKRWYKGNGYGDPDMTADKFLGKSKSPHIVIFRRGREVIAKDVATGNKGIAKCRPSDEFVFKTGASIALARLMTKTPEALNHDVKDEWIKTLGLTPVKKRVYTDADRDFKVGDRVVVRDWDDMAKEYGVSKWGDIPKDSQFTNSMKHLCGRTATVTCVGKVFSYKKVNVDFDDKSGSTACWAFNPWMFNPSDAPAQSKTPEAKFKVGDYVTLKEDVEADKRYGGLELLSGAMYDNAYNKRMTVVRVDWSDDSNTYYCECKGDSQFTFYYSEKMLDKWDESKIHEGDTVKVINTGLNYSSYVQWVEEHISDPSMAARFCFGSPSTDKNYKVIKIGEHEMNHRPLAYIEEIDGLSYNSCYLIEVKGLEKA